MAIIYKTNNDQYKLRLTTSGDYSGWPSLQSTADIFRKMQQNFLAATAKVATMFIIVVLWSANRSQIISFTINK